MIPSFVTQLKASSLSGKTAKVEVVPELLVDFFMSVWIVVGPFGSSWVYSFSKERCYVFVAEML